MGREAGQGIGLRILQVHTRYREAGGEDAVAETEAALLRGAGHDVVEWAPRNPAGRAGAAAALAMSAWNPRSARAVARLADRVQPDVAHVHNTWYAATVSVVAALAARGVPVVVTLHNYRLVCANAMLYRDGRPCEDCVGRTPVPAVVHRCYRGSRPASVAAAAAIALDRGSWSRRVALFLALNTFARDVFVKAGLPAARIRVKPNVVRDTGPRSAPPSAGDTVLFVGRLTPEKGVGALLDAWDRARPVDLRLVVVGDGPDRAALEARAVPGVTFTGRLDAPEVAQRMREARALALPSLWYEGQPMTVLEALAAGLPVLGADLGGTAELLGGLGEGWVLPAGDDRAWAAALGGLADGERVDLAGGRARSVFEARHSEAAGVRDLEAAYATARETAP